MIPIDSLIQQGYPQYIYKLFQRFDFHPKCLSNLKYCVRTFNLIQFIVVFNLNKGSTTPVPYPKKHQFWCRNSGTTNVFSFQNRTRLPAAFVSVAFFFFFSFVGFCGSVVPTQMISSACFSYIDWHRGGIPSGKSGKQA